MINNQPKITAIRPPRTYAFTLIELLVIIAILTILIAILLPSLGAARIRARFVKCQSNIRAWGKANLMYANDYGPLCYEGTLFNDTPVWADTSSYFNALPPYMNADPYYLQQDRWFGSGSTYDIFNGGVPKAIPPALPQTPPVSGMNSVFICPETTTPSLGNPDKGAITNDGKYFYTRGGYNGAPGGQGRIIQPSWMQGNPVERPHFLTYCWNAKLNNSRSLEWLKFSDLPQPDADLIMAEKAMRADEPKTKILGVTYQYDNLWKVKVSIQRLSTRHYLGFNALFADGHVASFKYDYINTTSWVGTNLVQNKPGEFVVDPWDINGGGQ
ncbi:MAG TPA: prepilin-type N-terminal cleavage/methylation domain-containing protein [Phycisphaerae bacterium]|nr:prepilin-type N-terminal cleavage/methylation domain-containing protein [Phycisphaerae bacterium]